MTNSYGVAYGECEYSVDLSKVAPEHKKLFNLIRYRQRQGKMTLNGKNVGMPHLGTYEYVNGVLTHMEHYKGIIVTDISRTKNEPFDVKMEALERVYVNSKNQIS